MSKFNEIFLGNQPNYPRKAVARFAETIQNPDTRKEFIERTKSLVQDTRSSFCSSKEIYEALKGSSAEEAGRVLYDGMGLDCECMDFIRPEDYGS